MSRIIIPEIKRRVFLALPLLAGCGLSERPYVERRQWPLAVARQTALPPRAAGKVLEIRTLRAGPGLEQRGLQALQADGSIRTGFYEEWAVPPAQGAEEALRRWLAESGIFAAVVAPGSRAAPDFALEGDLTALWSEPAARLAHASIAIIVIAQKPEAGRIIVQRQFSETAALAADGPQAEMQAMVAALAIALARIEAALRGVVA